MADEETMKKCGHTPCACTAGGDDDDYCSEYCREAHRTGITEIGCGCEHTACR